MKIEEILEEHNLLPANTWYINVATVTSKVMKTKIKISVEYRGNQGCNLDDVNACLCDITERANTIDYLDSLPHMKVKRDGDPDYLWSGEWNYKRGIEVEDPTNLSSED
jgi:hypothetical protein